MRNVLLFLLIATSPVVCISTPQAPAQTARQALIEMFFGKAPGTLVKHLPAATRDALEKSGALAKLQQYSLLMAQFQAQGQNVQTFDTGSVLLSGENAKTGDKVEITLENDALRGDQDDLELSFQLYKNGQRQPSPFNTQFTFSMKQEAQIWKLNEISVTIRLPLADPEFLKAITEKMKPHDPGITITASPAASPAPGANDAMVLAAMRQILAAEATYASTYPNVGYTCTLSDLDGFGGGEPNERQAMLINSGLASGKRYGFLFTLSGCGSSPATIFRLTAAPNANTFGRKAFCSDQSAAIRASQDGNPTTCLANGTQVQ
ncbi:MAG TPA: hypothetical protein VGG04_00795 [Candidatus Sulfotelmatobacter sp.]|jgi:type IV pilus assembly protein PilA